MSHGNGHLRVSGTRIEAFRVHETERHLYCSAWPSCNPFLYGSAPPVSTRITAGFPTGPNFLRPACPYPGCQLSSFAGSCPMENIPADYWLILCCLLTPVSVHQHLSADVS